MLDRDDGLPLANQLDWEFSHVSERAEGTARRPREVP
jgi:hypothetical protein